MSRYVFDSYALLARYWEEPPLTQVEELIADRDNERWMAAINLGEVFYKIAHQLDVFAAQNAIDEILDLPVRIIDADLELTLAAAKLKAVYPMSYADCFAAALAQQLDATVVTGDPEFERLERDGIIAIEWLAPKRKRRR